MLNRLTMDERIDNIVKNFETIDKATELYVFSWIRKSTTRDYFKQNSCYPKRNPKTGLFIWLYEPSEANTEQDEDLKQKSSDSSLLTCSKNMLDAFEGSVLAELSNSEYVPLLVFKTCLLFFNV